ncbi:hypothetical protein D1641_13135 [Colidextribacter sp. OB.20]|uniref:hypothetical protein n=1 Tax=Colidextribacter sp. OB.20 TaxID=2304568 RepID=UPI00136403A6|nr:hypothetical protein [Colidextribacter sp. OB.20]NBH78124.1 hypothetical protein [Clostridiaceae bacterium]NBI10947.1 hypothetical protein [Colidextribacter sp. OB.20]
MTHAIVIFGGGLLLAVLLMTAAILGGPVWGIVPVTLVIAGATAAAALLGLSLIEMLAMFAVATMIIAIATYLLGKRWGP